MIFDFEIGMVLGSENLDRLEYEFIVRPFYGFAPFSCNRRKKYQKRSTCCTLLAINQR